MACLPSYTIWNHPVQRPHPSAAGGFHAIRYTFDVARRVGFLRLWRAMMSRNACKTCALGMGGQKGGMRNELGHFPEVCKKSLQAMAADMQGALAPRFFQTFDLKALQAMTPRELETSGRLVVPLVARQGARRYEEASWDEAMATMADALRAAKPAETFFYFSGRSSNEAAFLLQTLARVYGTNHVNNCSYYCHQASGVGLGQAIGVGTATLSLEDVEHADLFFLIGGNPASNHPRLMTQLMQLRRRGGKVIVVNPMRETGLVKFRVPSDPVSLLFGTDIASRYVRINIGGDIAFLMGVAKALLADDHALAGQFIAAATTGFDATAEKARATAWDDIERESGVGRDILIEIAADYAAAKRAVFGWTMGITHHEHGVENVQWIVNLALMRGMVGKEGAGLLPIRGHSNVQGMGTVGVSPEMKEAMLDRFAAHGVKVPTMKGFDTMACMEAAARGELRVAVCLGGNLFGSNPDAAYARKALANVDLVVYLNTSLNTTHAHGLGKQTLILPVQARDEEADATTQESMFSYIRLSDGGKARHLGPKSEVEVVAELGERLFGGQSPGPIAWRDMRRTDAVRQLMASLVPGLEEVATIGATKREFTIPGRILHGGKFPTEDGKARFFPHGLPERAGAPLGQDDLVLMTMRSEGQFNTVVYEEHDYYRGQERRDIILMNADDMRRLGLTEDQVVAVSSDAGSMPAVRARSFDIKSGNAAMYYPEANILVPRRLDPQSRTPAFKAVRIRVTAAAASIALAGGRGVATASRPSRGAPGALRAIVQAVWRSRRPKLKSC